MLGLLISREFETHNEGGDLGTAGHVLASGGTNYFLILSSACQAKNLPVSKAYI